MQWCRANNDQRRLVFLCAGENMGAYKDYFAGVPRKSLDAVTSAVAGSTLQRAGASTQQVTTSGTVDMTIELQVSNDATNWITVQTIVTTTAETVGFENSGNWVFERAEVTTYTSGTVTTIHNGVK